MISIKSKQHKSSHEEESIEKLLSQAELAIRTWQSLWSPFLSAPLREKLLSLLSPMNELKCFSSGGFQQAERHRVCFTRNQNSLNHASIPMLGISIEGNFLFDKAKPNDFRLLIKSLGVKSDEIGDIWLIGDRGAEIICTPETAQNLNKKESALRDVPILFKKLELSQLQIPPTRVPKTIKTVEASTRIDAIASAGYGLSRAKIVKKIKEGQLRLNWTTISQASKLLVKGDRLNLENKGTVEVLNIKLTKKERWRIELLRH